MAAASAGAIKRGNLIPVQAAVGCVPQNSHQSSSQPTSNQQQILQHQSHHLLHLAAAQQQQQHHHHALHIQPQQQQQNQQHIQHHHLVHKLQPQQIPHRITYIQQRVPANDQNSLNLQRSTSASSYSTSTTSSISTPSHNNNHLQHNYSQYATVAAAVATVAKGPNVSKGWRRLIIKGDIVYVSPTGAALTNLGNVKEYLLKAGTCKCGLPCPLRPELFFNFDIQIPNLPLQASSDDGLTCSHVRRGENHNIVVGRRKIVTKEWANAVQQPQVYVKNGSTSNISNMQSKYVNQQQQIISTVSGAINTVAVDSKLSNLKLTRSPPWRKSSATTVVTAYNSNQQQQVHPDNVVNVNERVPPLPQQHIPQLQTAPHHQQIFINSREDMSSVGGIKTNRIIKTAVHNTKTKKKPNFKDDPTGYLDQQTAILQNSILSVPSPDIPIMSESPPTIIQQNNQNITINNNPIQIYNSNPHHHQVIGINSNNASGNFSTYPIQNNQIIIQQNDHGTNQSVGSGGNGVSNNQIISCNPHSQFAQLPNGVVQVHHSAQSNQTPQQPNEIIQQHQHIQLRQQIQQHDQLIRQTQQQLQQNTSYIEQDSDKLLIDSQESPVSSSTTRFSQTPDGNRSSPDVLMKGPVQGGTISTSNDSTSSSTSSSPVENIQESFRLGAFASSETTAKNTITSVLAGRAVTATTSVNPSNNFTVTGGTLSYQQHNQNEFNHPKCSIQNMITVSNNSVPDIHIQQMNREETGSANQFIMTSSGQIILMSNKTQSQPSHGNNQVIINNSNNSHHQFSIDNQNVQIISQQNILPQNNSQSQNKPQTYNNIISQHQHPQQQTVVLNTIPSSFLLQPNFVDGNQVIINQNNSSGNFVHQQQIHLSPDSKRRLKKRKTNMSPHSPHHHQQQHQQQQHHHHQQPPQIQVQQQPQNQSMLQIASQYSPQNFQLSPSLSGITIIPNQQKNTQQQIIMSHQNGQIIQPINLIGQQLLMPAGLVVSPETTLLQIQNCGSILTQQGMMLRAPSPQNKNFLSPNSGGQQYIVNSNGQISPVGQIYSTPVGLQVVPQTNSGQTYVQQNTTIVQQQTTMMNNSATAATSTATTSKHIDQDSIGHSVSTQTAQVTPQISSLPPDTTTHSPTSPERPTSSKSNNSDQMNMAMVQCVSSTETDAVSPLCESGQSPNLECIERATGFNSYQQTTFKSSENKIRRIDSSITSNRKISLDSLNESSATSSSSPTNLSSSPLSSNSTSPISASSSSNIIIQQQQSSHQQQMTANSLYSINELVWGSIRGYPAWPGKIINRPDGGDITNSGSAWVKWFGRKPNIELVSVKDLKSLSEGLDAHHKAQKDIRKSRKLNSQLENAIQEAMAELDRMSTSSLTSSSPTSSLSSSSSSPPSLSLQSKIVSNTGRPTKARRNGNTNSTQHPPKRMKLIKIAPAPAPPPVTMQPQLTSTTVIATANPIEIKGLRSSK